MQALSFGAEMMAESVVATDLKRTGATLPLTLDFTAFHWISLPFLAGFHRLSPPFSAVLRCPDAVNGDPHVEFLLTPPLHPY